MRDTERDFLRLGVVDVDVVSVVLISSSTSSVDSCRDGDGGGVRCGHVRVIYSKRINETKKKKKDSNSRCVVPFHHSIRESCSAKTRVILTSNNNLT